MQVRTIAGGYFDSGIGPRMTSLSLRMSSIIQTSSYQYPRIGFFARRLFNRHVSHDVPPSSRALPRHGRLAEAGHPRSG